MAVLVIEHLTKDYGHNRGVFDVSFSVEKGEVFGFLGPNGAGKTTAIRHIMGFSRPQSGKTFVNGMNSWTKARDIQKNLGYLPGEIALPETLTGKQFINMMADLRRANDTAKTEYLINKFELEPNMRIKRMPLGMKRKLAVVSAFMHDPEVLILDEPTSGLDPLMQETFIDFINEEKAKGKTILLSSHIFTEVNNTCDRIAIIKEGKIVSIVVANDLKHNNTKTYKLEFKNRNDFERFITEPLDIVSLKRQYNQVKVQVNDASINEFISIISNYELKFISQIKFTLEDFFMHFYDRNIKTGGAV